MILPQVHLRNGETTAETLFCPPSVSGGARLYLKPGSRVFSRGRTHHRLVCELRPCEGGVPRVGLGCGWPCPSLSGASQRATTPLTLLPYPRRLTWPCSTFRPALGSQGRGWQGFPAIWRCRAGGGGGGTDLRPSFRH